MIKQYRKKPVVVEAFKWLTDKVPDWWKELEGVKIQPSTGSAFIPTLEGTMEAKKGDYIIQGVQGEVYPCKPEIFAATYEATDTVQEPTDQAKTEVNPQASQREGK